MWVSACKMLYSRCEYVQVSLNSSQQLLVPLATTTTTSYNVIIRYLGTLNQKYCLYHSLHWKWWIIVGAAKTAENSLYHKLDKACVGCILLLQLWLKVGASDVDVWGTFAWGYQQKHDWRSLFTCSRNVIIDIYSVWNGKVFSSPAVALWFINGVRK